MSSRRRYGPGRWRLDPESVEDALGLAGDGVGLPWSPASLRADLVAAEGVHERVIMAQTLHKGTAMVRRYIREGNLFKHNAAAQVGL